MIVAEIIITIKETMTEYDYIYLMVEQGQSVEGIFMASRFKSSSSWDVRLLFLGRPVLENKGVVEAQLFEWENLIVTTIENNV